VSFEPNEMMMELFRSEVESHSEALTSSVLALEQDPRAATTLERMMRAAHSIKGAARIVRVNTAVDVAHVMEDCFVAAQKGKLTLTPDDFDVMLRGVDLLVKISAATKDPQTDWVPIESSVQGLVAELRGILQGRPAAPVPDVTALAPQPVSPAGTVEPAATSARPLSDSSPAIIVCPEFLDTRAAEQARRELLLALQAGSQEIQLNLAATHDLDTTGLAFLAAARQHVAAQSHTTLRFQPVSAELQTVLQVTGLDAAATGTAAQYVRPQP
jgi:chemotaxis protein histidine kinase CheA